MDQDSSIEKNSNNADQVETTCQRKEKGRREIKRGKRRRKINPYQSL